MIKTPNKATTLRYHISKIHASMFYQLHKFLFEGDFKELSNDARILYAILRDRYSLSLKNGWCNEAGEVYIIFPRKEMMEILGYSKPTIIKIIDELKKFKLMDEIRQGLSKPNMIYLRYPLLDKTNKKAPNIYFKRLKNFTSRSEDFLPLPPISNTNNNNILPKPLKTLGKKMSKKSRTKTNHKPSYDIEEYENSSIFD